MLAELIIPAVVTAALTALARWAAERISAWLLRRVA